MFFRSAFINILFFAGAILLAVLFVFPKYEEIQAKKSVIETRLKDIQNLQAVLQKTNLLKNEIENKKEDIEFIDKMLPATRELPLLIVNIEELARNSGLILEKIGIQDSNNKSGAESKGNEVKILSISLSFDGAYESFKNFIAQLENNPRLFNIQKIDFSAPSEESPNSTSFNLTLKAFYK